MIRFAVIQIHQCYDYVENLECIDVFDTKQEADLCVAQCRKHIKEIYTEFCIVEIKDSNAKRNDSPQSNGDP